MGAKIFGFWAKKMELAKPCLKSKLILDAETKKSAFLGLNNEKKKFFSQTAIKIGEEIKPEKSCGERERPFFSPVTTLS